MKSCKMKWCPKSALGFVIGVLLTFLTYFFMIYHLHYKEDTSTYVCTVLSLVLPLGLAFSQKFRCLLSLSVPQIGTGKGKLVLFAYILILTTNGPARNAVRNFHILINSTVCIQQKLVDLLPPTIQQNLPPVLTPSQDQPIRFESFEQTGQDVMNATMTQLKSTFESLEAMFNKTWSELDSQYGWLRDKQTLCRKLKTRFFYAVDSVTGSMFQNVVVLAFTPWLPMTLQKMAKDIITAGFQTACNSGDYDILGVRQLVQERIDGIKEYMKRELNFSVRFSHNYSYNFTMSKSMQQVQKDILDDIKMKFHWVQSVVTYTSFFLGSMVFMVFLKAIVYQRKYTKTPSYDNFYVSGELKKLDDRRRALGLETVLPIKKRERNKYVGNLSPRLVTSEKRKFTMNFFTWIAICLNVTFYVLLDYILIWVANALCTHADISLSLKGSVLPRIEIDGDGLLGQLFENIVHNLDLFGGSYVATSDLGPCLPRVEPPDYETYTRLGLLMTLSLLLTFLGAWILRLRHLVAGVFHPQMNRVRAAWLHRTILLRRTRHAKSFLKKFPRNPKSIIDDMMESLATKSTWYAKLFRRFYSRRSFCLVCGQKLNDINSIKECQNCKGVSCIECGKSMADDASCPICKETLDSADEDESDDISKECDSSDLFEDSRDL